jgi:plastocyanin
MRCLIGMAWLVVCGGSWPVCAAEVTVHLSAERGRPVSDAVVTLMRDVHAGAESMLPATTHVIDQKDETFLPYVQVLHQGDKVIFHNSDTTRHHVYSFSSVKAFEFVLRPGESSPSITLDKTGIAAVGCNIHDHMVTYLFISDVPAVGISDAKGDIRLDHLAPGSYTLQLWHPQLRPGHPGPRQNVTIAAEGDVKHLDFSLSLIPDPRERMDHEHMDY